MVTISTSDVALACLRRYRQTGLLGVGGDTPEKWGAEHVHVRSQSVNDVLYR